MNILFLCTANIQRSKTAETLLKRNDNNNTYRSAGLSQKYVSKGSGTLCNLEMLKWADIIYVFEEHHIERIKSYTGKTYLHKIINLNIPDQFKYYQNELIIMLTERLESRHKGLKITDKLKPLRPT